MDKCPANRKRHSNASIKKLFTSTFGPRNYCEENETEILERELANDDKPPPDNNIARIRRRGADVLHSKQVLLAVVLLNLIDCALVLGELMLDIHYIKEIIKTSDVASQKFINKMELRYPDHLYGNDIDHLEPFYDNIYEAECSWNRTLDTGNNTLSTGHESSFRTRREVDIVSNSASGHETAHAHSIWEDIAHGLHKTSIAILGVLFVENILKVLFMGRAFFQHKLEVFDAFIVLVSFVLDLVFLKGLTVYRIQDGILLLSFLLPWRVIRVVNSLIVAVLDHEHFRLKMMYKKQKNMAIELKDFKAKSKQFDFHIKRIERFCLSEGIPEWKVKHHTTLFREQSTVSSMASYALGGMLDGLMGQLGQNNLAFSRSWDANSSKACVGSGETSSLCSDSNSNLFGRGFVEKPSLCGPEFSAPQSTDGCLGNKVRKRIETGNEVFDSGRSSVSDVDFSTDQGGDTGSRNVDVDLTDHVSSGGNANETVVQIGHDGTRNEDYSDSKNTLVDSDTSETGTDDSDLVTDESSSVIPSKSPDENSVSLASTNPTYLESSRL